MSSTVWLVFPGVPPSLWSYRLRARSQIAGRSNKCDIHVSHDTVSRHHAQIWKTKDQYHIRDLKSRNGVRVNGKRVNGDGTFQIGDILKLGSVQLEVFSKSEVETATAVFESKATEVVEGKGTSASVVEISTMEGLSKAQIRVLRLLLKGHSEKIVAEKLYISPHTVHSHVKAIYRVLNVRSRAELMARFLSGATDDGANTQKVPVVGM